MSIGNPLSILLAVLLLTSMVLGQEAIKTDNRNPAGAIGGFGGLLQSGSLSDMLQITSDLRSASQSLERFGESLGKVADVAGEATNTTSRNMASMSEEFDPFGFKTAFKTIQQQNAIIQQQNRLIQELMQKEIGRLQQKPESPEKQQKKRKPRRQRLPASE